MAHVKEDPLKIASTTSFLESESRQLMTRSKKRTERRPLRSILTKAETPIDSRRLHTHTKSSPTKTRENFTIPEEKKESSKEVVEATHTQTCSPRCLEVVVEDSREDHRKERAFSTQLRSHSRNAIKEKHQN